MDRSCTVDQWDESIEQRRETGANTYRSEGSFRHMAAPFDAPADWSLLECRLWVIRDQAWYGQTVTGRSRTESRTTAPIDWLRFLLEQADRSTFLSDVIEQDCRWYRPDTDETEAEWRHCLSWLKPELRSGRLTVLEFELAIVLFDWFHPTPRFAPWVYYRPDVLRPIHQFLLKRYCWTLLNPLSRARQVEVFPLQDNDDFFRVPKVKGTEACGMACKLASPAYQAGEKVESYLRLWGVIVIGYLATFGADPVQHLVWNGPSVGPLFLAVLASTATLVLASTDVLKQHHGRIARREAARRAGRLLALIIPIGLLVAFCLNFLLFSDALQLLPVWLDDATKYKELDPWPMLPLAQSTSWWRLFVGTITLGSLSSLLGILAQWFWEDTSAIEPV